MNDPRNMLDCLANDRTITKNQRGNVRALRNELARRDDYITMLAKNDWFDRDCSSEYDRLYHLECQAWRLIDRLAP
jgi:hypothetical protein